MSQFAVTWNIGLCCCSCRCKQRNLRFFWHFSLNRNGKLRCVQSLSYLYWKYNNRPKILASFWQKEMCSWHRNHRMICLKKYRFMNSRNWKIFLLWNFSFLYVCSRTLKKLCIFGWHGIFQYEDIFFSLGLVYTTWRNPMMADTWHFDNFEHWVRTPQDQIWRGGSRERVGWGFWLVPIFKKVIKLSCVEFHMVESRSLNGPLVALALFMTK